MIPLKPGDKAPDFTLYDSTKKPVTLSDYTGRKVLLLFFPLAFTSVCTRELCGIRDNISVYNNADADIFGISVDSPQVLSKFKADQQLNFVLLSDFNKEASAAYGVLYERFGWMKGVSKRAAFVIDTSGIIQYAEVLENAEDIPDFATIEATLHKIN